MRVVVMVLLALVAAAGSAAAADPKDPLARARLRYNEGDWAAAVAAAEEARLVPGQADRADLIAARALLEQYRQSAAIDDLTAARDRLRRVNPERFNDIERRELVVGLGQMLYFDESPAAAAMVFESVLAGPDYLEPAGRERLLDWWASAVDADARRQPEIERHAMYQQILDRMMNELGANPTSATAPYWMAAAARGRGDLDGAWEAAQAAWARAPLTRDGGAALRGDVDRLVLRAIIPERAKLTARSADSLTGEWEAFKEKWNR
jgi:hypothetical protein